MGKVKKVIIFFGTIAIFYFVSNFLIEVIINSTYKPIERLDDNENIEVIKYKDVLIVYDEDAFKKLLPINRTIDGLNIRGRFIITGNDAKYKDFKDLTEEQIKTYTVKFELENNIEQEQGDELENE